MSVELFDIDEEPATKLVITIYNDGSDIIPAWWIEILERGYYDIAEIETMLDCFPNIITQLERLVQNFK